MVSFQILNLFLPHSIDAGATDGELLSRVFTLCLAYKSHLSSPLSFCSVLYPHACSPFLSHRSCLNPLLSSPLFTHQPCLAAGLHMQTHQRARQESMHCDQRHFHAGEARVRIADAPSLWPPSKSSAQQSTCTMEWHAIPYSPQVAASQRSQASAT